MPNGLRLAMVHCPLPGGPHVADLSMDGRQRLSLLGAFHGRAAAIHKPNVVLAVPVSSSGLLIGQRGQVLLGKLPQQLVHLVAAGRQPVQIGLVNQCG